MVSRDQAAFLAQMLGIARDVKAVLKAAVHQNGEELADRIRQNVPEDSGALAESVVVTQAGNETPAYKYLGGAAAETHTVPEDCVVVTVGGEEVTYAGLVEFGGLHNEPQPFFIPAVREFADQCRAGYEKAVSEAIGR
jgi:HK97 gp10 family phage protein